MYLKQISSTSICKSPSAGKIAPKMPLKARPEARGAADWSLAQGVDQWINGWVMWGWAMWGCCMTRRCLICF